MIYLKLRHPVQRAAAVLRLAFPHSCLTSSDINLDLKFFAEHIAPLTPELCSARIMHREDLQPLPSDPRLVGQVTIAPMSKRIFGMEVH
jgi:hypothetical protein